MLLWNNLLIQIQAEASNFKLARNPEMDNYREWKIRDGREDGSEGGNGGWGSGRSDGVEGGGLPRHFFVDSEYSLLYEVDTWQ